MAGQRDFTSATIGRRPRGSCPVCGRAFGTNTFIALYWIRHLGASRELGGAALTCFLVGGTLLGGRIADRWGMLRTIHIGGIAALPRWSRCARYRIRTSPSRRRRSPVSR